MSAASSKYLGSSTPSQTEIGVIIIYNYMYTLIQDLPALKKCC